MAKTSDLPSGMIPLDQLCRRAEKDSSLDHITRVIREHLHSWPDANIVSRQRGNEQLHWDWFQCPSCKADTARGSTICMKCKTSVIYVDADGEGFAPASQHITEEGVKTEMSLTGMTKVKEQVEAGAGGSLQQPPTEPTTDGVATEQQLGKTLQHARVAGQMRPMRGVKFVSKDLKKGATKWLKRSYEETIEAADAGRHPHSSQTNARPWGRWIKDNFSDAEFDKRRKLDPNWLCAAPVDNPGLWDPDRGYSEKTGAYLGFGFWDRMIAFAFVKLWESDPQLKILQDDLDERTCKLAVFVAKEVFGTDDPSPEGLEKAKSLEII